MDLQAAIEEAARCLLCDEAPCNKGCGADNEPATFIRQLRLGNLEGAVRTMRRNNVLAATCAQVCPTCRLCEQGCSRSGIDAPIRISEIQAFLAGYEREQKMSVLEAPEPGDRSVAVVGSGPAGLSAAAELALLGYAVTVYEKDAEPGGQLRYGIPAHRLPAELVAHEVQLVRDLGVAFVCGHEVASRRELEALLAGGFDAVFVAPGYDRPYSLGLGADAREGLCLWETFLRQSRDEAARPHLAASVAGASVVVVGGGAVAMDCAVTAKRLGADRVYAVSLESPEELPADEDEKELAFREGIRFRPSSRVTAVETDAAGEVTGVRGVEIRWREPGRFVPQNAEDVPGSEFGIPAGLVVEAIGTGFSAELAATLGGAEWRDGRVVAEAQTGRLSDPRIFAGGDLVASGRTVAASVLDGKRAAHAIAAAFPLSRPAARPVRRRPSLEIEFCGVRCVNPFFLSSSPVGNTAEMIARAFDAGWGGAVYKTLNRERDFEVVDPTPRLNALHNGAERFVALQNMEQISERPLLDNLQDIAWLKRRYPERVLVASIMGYSDEGWAELATRSEEAGADMVELNVSCPQMACEGAGFRVGQDEGLIERYTRVVKQHVSIPVMVKLTPNVTDIVAPARAARTGGADALAAINTVRSITEVDLETFAPRPSIEGRGSISGLSGTAVRPIALRFVAELGLSDIGLPVSGIGGIETWRDAAMFLLLGATNLQVTTAVMHYGYRIVESLQEGLEDYLEALGLASVSQLAGRTLGLIVDPSEHHQATQVVASVDREKCVGCGLCRVVCHDGANQAMGFDAVARKAEVDEARCVGCLLCRHVCPVWDCIGTRETTTLVTSGMHAAARDFVPRP